MVLNTTDPRVLNSHLLWGCYLYRPYQAVHTVRILDVEIGCLERSFMRSNPSKVLLDLQCGSENPSLVYREVEYSRTQDVGMETTVLGIQYSVPVSTGLRLGGFQRYVEVCGEGQGYACDGGRPDC